MNHTPWRLPGPGCVEHTSRHRSELVLLPEFALLEPVWAEQLFDQARWAAALARSDTELKRLAELHAEYVVGTRPASVDGRRFNEGLPVVCRRRLDAAAPQILSAR